MLSPATLAIAFRLLAILARLVSALAKTAPDLAADLATLSDDLTRLTNTPDFTHDPALAPNPMPRKRRHHPSPTCPAARRAATIRARIVAPAARLSARPTIAPPPRPPSHAQNVPQS